jgi:hypothetical protein
MQDLDIKEGDIINIDSEYWHLKLNTNLKVLHAEWYKGSKNGVLLRLEGKNYDMVVSRNIIKKVG